MRDSLYPRLAGLLFGLARLGGIPRLVSCISRLVIALSDLLGGLQLSRQRFRSLLGGIGTKPISGSVPAQNQKTDQRRDRQHGKEARPPAA